ncbi:GIY-YIG catalytic domain-containing protein [Streptomyces sp. Ag109_O5-1]|uniref:GIY-YIG nuclease family protein n=1 Tax=Streptomyces sp. Ag109_O5-1 TaxID=1938851 RepID=UPI000F8FE8B7|nr:GIY-YIG nuclease family protein [Streptomyces sp. Ag109_O5-1]RPE39722.1 GIY-YIG catalytic domain-containing protein [Streptomyces sp. Ag109_O5-1]
MKTPAVLGPGCTAVYRLYDRTGRLLYVGSSLNPNQRLKQHATDKPWWPEVDIRRATFEWCSDEATAADVEHTAALTEGPAYGSPLRRRLNRSAPRPRRMTPPTPPEPTGPVVFRMGDGRRVASWDPDDMRLRSVRNIWAALRRAEYLPPADPRSRENVAFDKLLTVTDDSGVVVAPLVLAQQRPRKTD